jgi:hypothetical protein
MSNATISTKHIPDVVHVRRNTRKAAWAVRHPQTRRVLGYVDDLVLANAEFRKGYIHGRFVAAQVADRVNGDADFGTFDVPGAPLDGALVATLTPNGDILTRGGYAS